MIKKLMQFILNIFFKILFFFHKPEENIDLEKTISLYQENNDFNSLFAEIRAWDAPYKEIEKLVPKSGVIVDLGCGDGLLANYLAISSPRRKVFGFELNKDRVKEADRGLKNTKFKYANILKLRLPQANTYILTHVLHHLPSKEDQIKLLTKISKKSKGTKLIIIEIDNQPKLKYWFTWLTDAFTVPILFEKRLYNFNFFYRPANEWKKILKDLGFEVKVSRKHKNMPFSHVIISAVKK